VADGERGEERGDERGRVPGRVRVPEGGDEAGLAPFLAAYARAAGRRLASSARAERREFAVDVVCRGDDGGEVTVTLVALGLGFAEGARRPGLSPEDVDQLMALRVGEWATLEGVDRRRDPASESAGRRIFALRLTESSPEEVARILDEDAEVLDWLAGYGLFAPGIEVWIWAEDWVAGSGGAGGSLTVQLFRIQPRALPGPPERGSNGARPGG